MPGDATAMTIAGHDPSSGAGVTADLAVFAAHGVFATSAVTALTVQSTVGVRRTEPVAPQLLRETIAALVDDLPPVGIKIGMLGGVEQVSVVIECLQQMRDQIPGLIVVLDPVLRSSSGAELLSTDATHLLRNSLLPLVDVVTPNAAELAELSGMPTETRDAIGQSAWTLSLLHPALTVITTAGESDPPNDLVLHCGELTELQGTRIHTRATHGTGCAFSTALLCALMRGATVIDAARSAKAYVAGALTHATERGSGRGPMNFFWQTRP